MTEDYHNGGLPCEPRAVNRVKVLTSAA